MKYKYCADCHKRIYPVKDNAGNIAFWWTKEEREMLSDGSGHAHHPKVR